MFSRLSGYGRCYHQSVSLSSIGVVASLFPSSTMMMTVVMNGGSNMNSSVMNDHYQHQNHFTSLQQYRYRWTKAKKKRTKRYEYRQLIQSKGIELPKPPYYFPKHTPVVNAQTQIDIQNEIQQHDMKVTEELQQKLHMVNQVPVLRHHMTGISMSERVQKLFHLHNGNQREVIQAQKQRGMELFQIREGDTGSPAVQVIALTTRIQQLQTHLSLHKKDKHSKRGMDALYIKRRKTLDYLEREDFDSYRRVVKTLGLIRN